MNYDKHGPCQLVRAFILLFLATILFSACQSDLSQVPDEQAFTKEKLEKLGNMLQLEVEDDGHGIVAADFARSRSLGLKGMRERVRYIGGSVEIGHAPRGGTRVLVRVPKLPMRAP